MSIELVREHFRKWNLQDQILEFPVSSATVELAAQALGCAPERIAKTLSFQLPDSPLLVVTAGDARIDNSKFKGLFHVKAKMLSPEDVEEKVGHAIGGVCPFGIREDVKVYLDVSLKRFHTVFPACGSSNSAIELTPDELEQYAFSLGWIDVCKGWQDETL